MKRLFCLAGATLMAISPAVLADDRVPGNPTDYTLQSPYSYDMQLADNSTSESAVQNSPPASGEAGNPDDSAETFKPSLFTRNTLHEYLGLGSLGLATVALLAPKERHGLHEYAAKGAAALGGAAVISGLIVHWDDLHLSYGLHDPDNVHALLASMGAAGFLVAVSKAPKEGHAGAGMLGYAAMLVGIRIVW